MLLEWLNFVGCKIPVTIYCISNNTFLQKMKVSTSYKYLYFTDNLNSIEKFVQEKDGSENNFEENYEGLKMVKVNRFTLYKVNYIINKKSTFRLKVEESSDEDEEKSLLKNNKKETKKLNLHIEDNEKGIDNDNNKEDRKGDDSSLISNSENDSNSEGSNSEK